MVNTSIMSCLVPTELKTAIVSPFLQKPRADWYEFKNYRPVSNLRYTSKFIEKVVVTQLHTHVNGNSLNAIHQSGHSRRYSTETALLKIINDLRAMDNNRSS